VVKDWLKGRSGFPFIEISTRPVEEGEDVYSFGFPLTETNILPTTGPIRAVATDHSARVTSAIVASRDHPRSGGITIHDNLIYVIDKALNYGNSGGPIVATESGKVFAICSQFQKVRYSQPQVPTNPPHAFYVELPSLYGFVLSLSNKGVIEILERNGISTSTD
jgi:serine protease Do